MPERDTDKAGWGGNDVGQLGFGLAEDVAVPVEVSGRVAFASIGAGDTHNCAVTMNGAGYCWGTNNLGFDLTPKRVGGQE